MDATPVKSVVEALLFVSEEPLPFERIREAAGAETEAVKTALKELAEEYDRDGRAFTLEAIGGGYQLLTRPEYVDAIRRLGRARSEGKLSPAALETLAIIAYKQPISRADIESVRGVQSGGVLDTLLDRDLARVAGRGEGLGRPMLYGTTRTFLTAFGLKSIKDLPALEDAR